MDISEYDAEDDVMNHDFLKITNFMTPISFTNFKENHLCVAPDFLYDLRLYPGDIRLYVILHQALGTFISAPVSYRELCREFGGTIQGFSTAVRRLSENGYIEKYHKHNGDNVFRVNLIHGITNMNIDSIKSSYPAWDGWLTMQPPGVASAINNAWQFIIRNAEMHLERLQEEQSCRVLESMLAESTSQNVVKFPTNVLEFPKKK